MRTLLEMKRTLLVVAQITSVAAMRRLGARMSTSTETLAAMRDSLSKALGKAPEEIDLQAGMSGFGGGGGASVGSVVDKASDTRYFVKSGGLNAYDMLNAEFEGVRDMHETGTIAVPRPVAKGTSDSRAFAIFEHLAFCGGGQDESYEMGRQLALMHRCTSPNGKFGWRMDNTCGATPQPNGWRDTWADFWAEHRLGHMLRLTGVLAPKDADKLQAKVRDILGAHDCQPSLVHGDLWGGNAGFHEVSGETRPVIFDPATYYGDREVDVAMTYLFGGFGAQFYQGYEDEWPLADGFAQRKVVYNMYHIMNHCVLFGGGYCGQSKSMAEQVLRM